MPDRILKTAIIEIDARQQIPRTIQDILRST
jgi:hypothetical protein